MSQILTEISFLGERFNGKSIIDILLVSAVFYIILTTLQGTQANTLIRGLCFAGIIIALLFVLVDLPAFSWLMSKIVPVLIIVIPVIFAPEIRRIFEQIGRAHSMHDLFELTPVHTQEMYSCLDAVTTAASRLSSRNHGALIVLENRDNLEKFIKTGVELDSIVSAELLLQIFYPNTPLHDGAVIISEGRIVAAACIMPLSSRNVLDKTPEHQMGLRHRAALGISENTDAITVVVSEETGNISITHNGKLHHDVSPDYLLNYLKNIYKMPEPVSFSQRIKKLFTSHQTESEVEDKEESK